jgi:predicted neuraminidase
MQTEALFHSQEIFAALPELPSCHASTLLALPQGDLLMAFYAGSVEKAADVSILLCRYDAASATWSPPEVVIDRPEKSVGNPVLHRDREGTVWLYYLVMQGHKWHHCSIHSVRSHDDGQTWGEDSIFRSAPGWTTRNNLIELADGTALFPLSDNVAGCSVFMRSTLRGGSWQELGRIPSEPSNEQPAVIQRSDGSLLAIMRTGGKGGACWQSNSYDGGQTWTPALPGPFRNPNSAMAMIRLASGGLVAAYNDTDNYRRRTPLRVALSADEGRSWPYVRTLEDRPGEFTYLTTRLDNSDSVEFSYPALAEDDTGTIHAAYTNCRLNIKHAAFNESWLRER